MQKDLLHAIRATLAYADIFDYPLTSFEIWKFLIAKKRFSQKEVFGTLSTKNSISTKAGFYYLSKRTPLVYKRRKNAKYNKEKYTIAQKMSSYIGKLPTVLFVGLTGSVSMQNAQENDDIDLFLITKKNTMWISRFTVMILLELLGIRRKKNETHPKNKICINLYMDERFLAFKQKTQNLYTAHEVVQVIPLFNRKDTYGRFLQENRWVERFLPNALGRIKNQEIRIKKNQKRPLFIIYYGVFLLEKFAKRLQLWYMKEDRIKASSADHMIAFYPHDYSERILTLYKKRIKQYE